MKKAKKSNIKELAILDITEGEWYKHINLHRSLNGLWFQTDITKEGVTISLRSTGEKVKGRKVMIQTVLDTETGETETNEILLYDESDKDFVENGQLSLGYDKDAHRFIAVDRPEDHCDATSPTYKFKFGKYAGWKAHQVSEKYWIWFINNVPQSQW